jgi:hypothetical protein
MLEANREVEANRGAEAKRGAEPDWGELTAPLRQAGQALGAAGKLVRQLDDEATLWRCMRALNELPACVTFHPFATTAHWYVELEREQTHAMQATPLQAWSPELTRRARRRRQISVVDSPAAALPSSAAQSLRAVKTDSTLPASSPAGRASRALPAARLMPATGAWSALLGIVQLIDEVQSMHAPQSSSSTAAGPSVAQERRRDGASRADPPLRALAAAIDAPTARPPNGEIAAANTDRPAASESQPATVLLAEYVAALWNGAGAPANPQTAARESSRGAVERAAGPRPRAPSLLLSERAPREAPSGADAHALAADDSAPSTAWPANDPGSEDPLAERLNRELLEQAWLRGVDLT